MAYPILKTPRLVLRAWRDDDLPAFAALNADPRVMRFFMETLNRAESDAWVQRTRAHFDTHGFGLWALEAPGASSFIGFTGLSVIGFQAHFTPAVDIAWRLACEYWGRGYATEAAQAALRFGFQELRLDEIVSFAVPHNLRSRRVMERIGMTHCTTEDFEHPRVPAGHPLCRHVLYRLSRDDWARSGGSAAGQALPAIPPGPVP
jgi:ribosomal-protein-alanine N-acetyltransferase